MTKVHSYLHNIKTFNNATRHLTPVERMFYRELIELYYDTEQPLPAVDFDALCRRVLARSDAEKEAVRCVLREYFEQTGDVYSHDYCDRIIEEYHSTKTAKAKAGKASAAARAAKAEARKEKRSKAPSNKGEQLLNMCSTERQQNPTNHKPETINHKPDIDSANGANGAEVGANGDGASATPEPKPDPESGFAEFYAEYPRKRDKGKALKAWIKHGSWQIKDKLLADVRLRKKSDRNWLDGYAPYPATYLNNERWEDEIEKPINGQTKTDQRPAAERPESNHARVVRMCVEAAK